MGAGHRIRIRRVAAVVAATMATILALTVGVASAGGGNHVKAVNFSFKPGKIVIHKGQKVTWKRIEGRHTVTFKHSSIDKVLSRRNPRVTLKFKHRGTFRYFCRFHATLGMNGKVVVR
jgi:plastocyanin